MLNISNFFSQDTTFIEGWVDYSYLKNWTPYCLKKTTEIKILKYWKAEGHCGTVAYISLTIGVTNKNDTIRILTPCEISDKFKEGQTIKIKPLKPSCDSAAMNEKFEALEGYWTIPAVFIPNYATK